MSLQPMTSFINNYPSAPFQVRLFEEADTAYENFAAAVVLPEQFYSPPAFAETLSGHLLLRWAVLMDAINTLTKPSKKTGRRQQRIATETKQWFFTDDEHWPFSFSNICAALRLDPAYIRQGLLRSLQGRDAPGAAPEQPRRRHYVVRRSFQLAA